MPGHGRVGNVSIIKVCSQPFAPCRTCVVLVTWLIALRIFAQEGLEQNYAVGDVAKEDVVTPVPLVVFDAARTEELRRAEARKVSPVVRHVPAEADRAEAELRRGFAEMRKRFGEELERVFQHGPPLLNSELSQPQFHELWQSFGKRNAPFPMSRQLAELWALDDNGELFLERMLAGLRPWKGRYLMGSDLPRGERGTTGNVRLVSAESVSTALNPGQVDRGRNLARTNLVNLDALRRQTLASVDPGESNVLHFAFSFLRPTCFFEQELTQQARTRRVEAINAADHFEAGERLVAKGETISPRMKLALDELRTRTEGTRLEFAAARERAVAMTEATRAREAAEAVLRSQRTNRWLLGGLVGAGLVAFALGGLLWRRRLQTRASMSNALVPAGANNAWSENWQQRAVSAEARADKATSLLRTQMLPHVARSMVAEVFQRLWAQKVISQSANAQAEVEVAELARRLEELHAPLQDRLQAYEQRIAELEAELALKGQENQALIQAKIESTRKMLEGERNLEGANWQ